MLGVRPIKMNIQIALCEQAPNSILYIQFCMAELLRYKLYRDTMGKSFDETTVYCQ